jgi:hypothetical protein
MFHIWVLIFFSSSLAALRCQYKCRYCCDGASSSMKQHDSSTSASYWPAHATAHFENSVGAGRQTLGRLEHVHDPVAALVDHWKFAHRG